MFDIQMLLGRFHPLIVHLPIGFILIAIILKSLEIFKKEERYRPAFVLILRLSILASVAACITGFLLSRSGNYPDRDINFHMYGGLALVATTIGWYWLETNSSSSKYNRLCFGITGLLLLLTGHWGGDLTHGKGYLLQGLPPQLRNILGGEDKDIALTFDISNIDSAMVYHDIVQPLLEARCYTCHSDKKQKGDLRLDDIQYIHQGGESGEPLFHSDLSKSQLYKALTAPMEDDLHMPPKGKTQLSVFQIEAIGDWVSNGGDINLLVQDAQPNAAIYKWYEDELSDQKLFDNFLIPEQSVSKADENVIKELQSSNILIQPVGKNSNFLEVSLINARDIEIEALQPLLGLVEQVIWLEMPNCELTEEKLALVNQLTTLTKINMAHSSLSETSLQNLANLSQLKTINLTGVNISPTDLEVLNKWTELKKIFLYQTNLNNEELIAIQQQYPALDLYTGGYQLPSIPEDTMVYKFIPKK